MQHTVEAGVAHDGDVGDANGIQQFAALLVLHIEVRETAQYVGILTTIPAEEYLAGTEDAADAIDWYATMAQDVQVVVPELVLDEEGHDGSYGSEKASGIGDSVQWQVADEICTFVVLAHFIA